VTRGDTYLENGSGNGRENGHDIDDWLEAEAGDYAQNPESRLNRNGGEKPRKLSGAFSDFESISQRFTLATSRSRRS
jgi:hypothetical protein